MLERLKYTIKSTIIYSLGGISIKLIGLILLPIYTDYLTTEQYGMWAILEVTAQILATTIGLRLSTSMIRFYSSEKETDRKKKIIFTAFGASLLSILIFNLLTHPFVGSFSVLFFNTNEFEQYFTFLILWSSFEILNRLVLDLIRIKERPGLYITVTVTKFTVILLLNIFFIVVLNMGIGGIILGQLIGSALLILITTPFLLREMILAIDFGLFSKLFRYGFPLVFSGISVFVFSLGDRYLVKLFLGYHEVGIYSLSYKISNVVKLVLVQAFQLGFLPIAFNIYDKPNAKRFFSKIFTYYAFAIFWFGLAVSVFAREFIIIFASSRDYYEAYLFVPWITLAICFYGLQNFYVIGMHYAKRTKVIAVITLVAASFNIVLNVLLIPRIGLYGAVISAIGTSLLMTILSYQQSQKYYHISYEIPKVLIILGLSITMYFLSLIFNPYTPVVRTILKSALILLFPFLLYMFGFYDPIEILRIKGVWKKWHNPTQWPKNIRNFKIKGFEEED
ncbi:MAG: oligosaccharide flippase family protein [Bacteroidota bacterium]|nr:oligosaccharide flippase family protein [Bacteroidota bacterium]